jgi:catalase
MAMERSAGHRSSTPLAIASATRRLTAVCVKLYTKQGNWDLVGNNIPVFFIQDAIKFPDISMP